MLRLNLVQTRCEQTGIDFHSQTYRNVYIPGGLLLFFATEPGLNLGQLTTAIDEHLDHSPLIPDPTTPCTSSDPEQLDWKKNFFFLLEGRNVNYKMLIKFYGLHGPSFSVPQLLRYSNAVLAAIKTDCDNGLILHEFLAHRSLRMPRTIIFHEPQAAVFMSLSSPAGIQYLTQVMSNLIDQASREAKLEEIAAKDRSTLQIDINKTINPPRPRSQTFRVPSLPSTTTTTTTNPSPTPSPRTPRPDTDIKRPRFGN